MSNQILQFSKHKYFCVFCDFYSNNLTNYRKHLETMKHKSCKISNKSCNMVTNLAISCNSVCYECSCGKKYKYKSGLSTHKKKCEFLPENKIKNLEAKLDVVEQEKNSLKQENQELQHAIIDTLQKQLDKKDEQINELIPKVGGNITFNINNFLNDTCKNAITLQDFVKNITISMENLLLTHDKGLSVGISNIIIENMSKLAFHERPIHCSDKKREILYVKNEKWEKDQDKKNTIDMIDRVHSKQMKSMYKMKDHDNIEFDVLVKNCVSDVNDKKIVKDICDGVYVKEETNQSTS